MINGSDLSLRTWDVVRLQNEGKGQWATDVVYRVRIDRDEFDVGLEPIQRQFGILIGDRLRCKYVNAGREYILLGEVTEIGMRFPQSITMRVMSAESREDERDSVRYDVNLSSIVKNSTDTEQATFANVRNISASGMSFITHMELERLLGLKEWVEGQSIVQIETFVRPDKILNLHGIVMRTKTLEKGFEYGIRFLNPDSADNRRLQMFLYTLEDELNELVNRAKTENESPED